MSTRHTHRWLAWLLPLMLLRTCVPAGFMLAWSEQGLQVVLCAGMGPMPAGKAQHGSHPAAGEHDHSAAHDTSLCPFAVVQVGGALPACVAASAFVVHSSGYIERPVVHALAADPVLIDRIRGPPLA